MARPMIRIHRTPERREAVNAIADHMKAQRVTLKPPGDTDVIDYALACALREIERQTEKEKSKMYTSTTEIVRENEQVAYDRAAEELARLKTEYGDAVYLGIVIDRAYPRGQQVSHVFFVPVADQSDTWERVALRGLYPVEPEKAADDVEPLPEATRAKILDARLLDDDTE